MAEEDAPHKRALRRCRTQLIEDLDFESVIDYLISKEVFPMTRVKNMKDEKYSSDRIRALLENIEKADPSVYKTFLKGLRETKQDHLRSLLLKEENKVKTEMSQKKGERTEKSTKSAESPSKLGEMKAYANITDASVGRPKPTSAQVDTSDLTRITDTLSLKEPPVGGNSVTDGCQPSAIVQFRNVTGKEQPHKIPSDVADGPDYGEDSDQLHGRLDKATAGSSELNHSNFNVQNPTQTTDVDGSTQDTLEDTTEEPDNEFGQVADGNSCKPYQSLGNLSSYADVHQESNPAPIASIVKAQHYRQKPEGWSLIQPHSVNAQRDANTSVASGGTLSERPPRSSACQNRNCNPMTQVEQDLGATQAIPLLPRTTDNNIEILPIPAMQTNHNAPSSQPRTSKDTNTWPDRLAALDTSDEHLFLEEVFDACVIYPQHCRNHADEIVRFIESLPEGYKVCYYDDDLHFGLFSPESHPEVLYNHCILHLIVISDNFEGDKDANFILKTITMLNKHNAKVRSVLFKEEDEKYIPKSMANVKKIAWYHWHDEGKGHLKANLNDLLRQCRAVRKRKESQNVRSKKHVD